jgi:hypothetical protein
MGVRNWDDVRAGLFAGREDQVAAAEEQLRAAVAAGYELTGDPQIRADSDEYRGGEQYSFGPQEEP